MVEWTQISDLYCRVLYGEVIKNTLMQDPFNITINYQRIYFNGHFLAVKLLYNSKCPSMTFLFVCLMFFSEIFFLTTLVTEHLLNNSLCPFVCPHMIIVLPLSIFLIFWSPHVLGIISNGFVAVGRITRPLS